MFEVKNYIPPKPALIKICFILSIYDNNQQSLNYKSKVKRIFKMKPITLIFF
jgi:hypothetical protein